jgi:hypothetical protein
MFAVYPDWLPLRHDDPAPAAARPPAGDVERIAAVLRGIWRARRALDAHEQQASSDPARERRDPGVERERQA